LGLGDRVVGVSAYCRFPPEVLSLPKVGTFLQPDPERIAALRPDLVFVHETGNGVDRRLASLHIPFVAVVARGTIAGAFAMIRQIGAAANVSERAETLVSAMTRQLDGIRAAQRQVVPPRVLFIVGRRPGMLADLVAVGPGTYLDELIAAAGASNVLDIKG